MAVFIALLRAVNVGGTGKLPMRQLASLCEAAGFTEVQTYIASGNVAFRSELTAMRAKAALEQVLLAHLGKAVGVVIRSLQELRTVLAGNPFPDADPRRCVVLFFDEPLPVDCLDTVRHRGDEQLQCGERELYVHYVQGMGNSKLVIPAARNATGRNLNTLTRLVEIASSY